MRSVSNVKIAGHKLASYPSSFKMAKKNSMDSTDVLINFLISEATMKLL